MIDKKQNIVDFYTDTSESRTWSFTFKEEPEDASGLQYSYTGTGGATAFWNAWRSDNSDLDGTSGTVLENAWYDAWSEFSDGRMHQDGNVKSIGEIVAIQQSEIDYYTNYLVNVQAEIDAGNGDVDPTA